MFYIKKPEAEASGLLFNTNLSIDAIKVYTLISGTYD